MIPLLRYARISRITPTSSMRLLNRSIRMSWLTRLKNFSRSTSTTTCRPACTCACAANTASCARRPGAKAVAVLAKSGVQNRLQHLQQRLLDQPIRHRRNAKLALATVGLWNQYPSHRTWPVRPRQRLLSDRRPRGDQMLCGLVDVQPVHTRCTFLARTRLSARRRFSLVNAACNNVAWGLPVSLGSRRGSPASSLAGSRAASPRAAPARPADAGI